MPTKKSKNMWIVVLVESGVTAEVGEYADKQSALRREKVLRRQMNVNDDDLSIFEGEIGKKSLMPIMTATVDDLIYKFKILNQKSKIRNSPCTTHARVIE